MQEYAEQLKAHLAGHPAYAQDPRPLIASQANAMARQTPEPPLSDLVLGSLNRNADMALGALSALIDLHNRIFGSRPPMPNASAATPAQEGLSALFMSANARLEDHLFQIDQIVRVLSARI